MGSIFFFIFGYEPAYLRQIITSSLNGAFCWRLGEEKKALGVGA